MQTYRRDQLPSQPERSPEAQVHHDGRPHRSVFFVLPACLITAAVVAFLAVNAWHQQPPAVVRSQPVVRPATPHTPPIAVADDLRRQVPAAKHTSEGRGQRVHAQSRHTSRARAVRARWRAVRRARELRVAMRHRRHRPKRSVIRIKPRIIPSPRYRSPAPPPVVRTPAHRVHTAPSPSASGGAPPAPSGGGAPACSAFDFC